MYIMQNNVTEKLISADIVSLLSSLPANFKQQMFL